MIVPPSVPFVVLVMAIDERTPKYSLASSADTTVPEKFARAVPLFS